MGWIGTKGAIGKDFEKSYSIIFFNIKLSTGTLVQT